MRRTPFFMLAIIALAVFGTGIADTMFDWYVPPRPYTHAFIFASPQALRNSLITDLFGIVIMILLFNSLAVQIANRTTGIVIAHSGFTPNINLTSSPGLSVEVQLIPFIFIAVLVFGITKVLQRQSPGGL